MALIQEMMIFQECYQPLSPSDPFFVKFFENLEGDAFSGVDRATILPTLERFLPIAWNESMVTWHLPYWKSMFSCGT